MGRHKSAKDAGLTGSLKDFGLTDLFQILGQQQKTGILNLQENKKGIIQVQFDKGMIVGVAFPSEASEETSLGRRLIQGRLLSPDKWKRAYQQHKEELISIERALIKSEMIRTEDLIAVMRLLTFETIYNLFKWKGGAFWFDAREVYYDSKLVEPLQAEYLLLDVLRMVDEWPLLAKRIPNFAMVMQKVDPLVTLEALTGTSWEKSRSFQMELIYDLVNGLHTVKEIIDLSFVGEFDTCKNLIELMDAGLIDPVPISAEVKKKRGIQVAQHLLDAGVYLTVFILGFLLIFQLTATRREGFPLSENEWKALGMAQDYLRKIEKEKMANAREVFFLEMNRYPANPAEMVKRGLLPR
ncbi:MAG: DUF4388 domain-containing protein [Deltaproteobacteria bacterium]|nr:DUF4388 domain-containing protein [Deltaproteobacteria bacterium]